MYVVTLYTYGMQCCMNVLYNHGILPDMDRVSEGEEDLNIRSSRSKSKAYTHKEVIIG